MGELIDGHWRPSGVESTLENGALRRRPSIYRNMVEPQGAETEGDFVAASGRYHLYVSLACPWASRTIIMRRLKGLESIIGMSVVHWHMGDEGWTFQSGQDVVPDAVNGTQKLRDLYLLDDPSCTTRVTVPVLWDRATARIVSNESQDIVRMMNSAFDDLGASPGDYYPLALRGEIDAVNERIYEPLNNGVYRAGMATSQTAYDGAVADVFETLDWLEHRLTSRRYLLGSDLTESDIRLFTTLVRFDSVYFGHFKCNRRPLSTYPALWAYTRDLFKEPAFGESVDLFHIKQHYYGSHPWLNPTGIVPDGPVLDFNEPANRETLSNPVAPMLR